MYRKARYEQGQRNRRTDGLYTATIYKDDGTPEVKPAWCADLTEELSGDVGIIEIAGDIDKGVNVQPGYEGNAVYNAARDGAMYEVPHTRNTTFGRGVLELGHAGRLAKMAPGLSVWNHFKYRHGCRHMRCGA